MEAETLIKRQSHYQQLTDSQSDAAVCSLVQEYRFTGRTGLNLSLIRASIGVDRCRSVIQTEGVNCPAVRSSVQLAEQNRSQLKGKLFFQVCMQSLTPEEPVCRLLNILK